MSEREPNFNARLQAAAARALLSTEPGIVVDRPEQYASSTGESGVHQTTPGASGRRYTAHDRDPRSRQRQVAAPVGADAVRQLLSSPRGRLRQMLLSRGVAADPNDPVTRFNQEMDRHAREGEIYPHTGQTQAYGPEGRSAYARFEPDLNELALRDIGAAPISQGPPHEGYTQAAPSPFSEALRTREDDDRIRAQLLNWYLSEQRRR